MRKLLVLILTLALLAGFALTGYAASEPLTLSDGTAAAGNTVYLVVTLHESAVGDTVGISYSYDTKLLKAVPSSCTWERKSTLDDFDNKNSGVWAASKAEDLKGKVCTLALNILPGVQFTETEVTCALIVKNGAEEVGTFEAKAKVTLECLHEFGEWADQGAIGHSRACSLCGNSQTQPHEWDAGKITADPSDPAYDLKTHTCGICGAQKSLRIPSGQEDTQPPQDLSPTDPKPTVPEKEHPYTQPPVPTEPNSGSKPGSSQGGSGSQNGGENPTQSFHDYNQGTEAVSGGDGHDHSHDDADGEKGFVTKESRPVAVPGGDAAETETAEHDHDHDHITPAVSSGERAGTALGIAAVVLVLLGGAVWFVKKKH